MERRLTRRTIEESMRRVAASGYRVEPLSTRATLLWGERQTRRDMKTRTLENGNTLTVVRDRDCDQRKFYRVAEHNYLGTFLLHAFASFSKREANDWVELQAAR